MNTEANSWLAAKAVNQVVSRLARGLPVAALGIRGARTTEVVRIARSTGHHAVWIDLEHSAMPIDTAAMICTAALDVGLVPFVRVPERDYGVIGRVLDGGAQGIIFPRIETAAQVTDLVAACRFPPLGHRSTIASLPQLEYRHVPAAQLHDAVNRATAVKVLIESPRGIENVDSIAAVSGVDIVGIGTNDLAAEMGVAGNFRHPEVRKAHDAALAACRRAQKPLVIGGIGDLSYVAELIRLGAAPFLFTGIDTELLLGAAHDRIRQALASINA